MRGAQRRPRAPAQDRPAELVEDERQEERRGARAGAQLAARDIDATNDVGDENDTETTLRSLPYWLLAGAQADAAAKENAGLMYMTYLVDWDLEEAAPLAGSFKKEGVEVLADDKWIVDFSSDAKSWGSLTGPEKVKAVAGVLLKLTLVVAALYFFICSLSFLASRASASSPAARRDDLPQLAHLQQPDRRRARRRPHHRPRPVVVDLDVDRDHDGRRRPLHREAGDPPHHGRQHRHVGHLDDRRPRPVARPRRVPPRLRQATVHDMFNFLSVACS